MKVLVASTAGEGHFAPLTPFARAAAAAGHEVRVAAPASFRPRVEAAGLEHAPVDDVPPERFGPVMGRLADLSAEEANAIVIAEVFGRLDTQAALPGMRRVVDAWRPDVVLREPAELASLVVAHERGLPVVQVGIGLDSLLDLLDPLLDAPLAEVGCARTGRALREGPRFTLLPASFDVPADAPSPPHRFREDRAAAEAAPLPDWWDGRGDPLVYVSFGSVAARMGFYPSVYAALLEALAPLPVRVLLTTGADADPTALGTPPANAHVERWWPQREVLPHTAVVVGHGGFGTTTGAMVAGVPQVVVPLFSLDQYLNALRVAAVGLGSATVREGEPRRAVAELLRDPALAVAGLPAAVEHALSDHDVRARARAVAADVAALPPVSDAVPVLEALAAGHPAPV